MADYADRETVLRALHTSLEAKMSSSDTLRKCEQRQVRGRSLPDDLGLVQDALEEEDRTRDETLMPKTWHASSSQQTC